MSQEDLELRILKSIISNKKNGLSFAQDYDAKLFSSGDLWNFANTVVGYIKVHKDLPTLRILTDKLATNKPFLSKVNTIWGNLENLTIDDKEYQHDLAKLKKNYAEKQILDVSNSLASLDPDNIDVNKALNEIQKTTQSIKALNQSKSFERRSLKDEIPIFRDEYNAKIKDPNFDSGIKTGYSVIDDATGGLRPGELLLIGAESGAGKSLLLMNMAVQIWMQKNTIDMENGFFQGFNVLYFSLEMPFKPCRNRILGRLSSNPTKNIRSATLNNNEAAKLKKALKFIQRYPNTFEIVDVPRGATVQTIEQMYEEAKANYNPDVVVVDYLSLLNCDEKDIKQDDWLKLGSIAGAVSEFSRANKIITLSAVQLNRAKPGAKEEEKIGMHRVGRSALILHHSNIAIQINSRMQEKNYPDMNIHIIKNRDGEQASGSLIKDLACGTLLDNKQEGDDEPGIIFGNYGQDDISERAELLDI